MDLVFEADEFDDSNPTLLSLTPTTENNTHINMDVDDIQIHDDGTTQPQTERTGCS